LQVNKEQLPPLSVIFLETYDFTCEPIEIDHGWSKQLTIYTNQKQKTCKNGTKSKMTKNSSLT
jgi:hypothetical protein